MLDGASNFLNNLKRLPELHPAIFQEFKKGNMGGYKSNRKFSGWSISGTTTLVKDCSSTLSLVSKEKGLKNRIITDLK